MKTFITVLFLLYFLSGCSSGSSSTAAPTPPAPDPVPEKISFSGSGDLGIFDPSLSRDPASGRLWMSYSSVNTSAYYSPSLYWRVSIRLAYSDDNGSSWQDAGIVAASDLETIVGPLTENHPTAEIPADSKGIWQSETSSLVYDPSAPASERWKLIWHQYLNANLTSFFADYSWIAMKAAATPAELATATAVKLFAGIALQPDNTISTSPVFAPIGGAPAIQLNADLNQVKGTAKLSELNFCIFAEPGLHATSSALYLVSYCADASTIAATGNVTEYIVYFRCASPCNMSSATSWEYLGRLLSPADAQNAGAGHHFQAPALAEKNGRTYLLVTPVDTTSGERYDGCRVYELSDINGNQLRRSNGQLLEIARVDGDAGSHHGACAAYSNPDDDLIGGILLSQFGIAGTADTFTIYKSQVNLP